MNSYIIRPSLNQHVCIRSSVYCSPKGVFFLLIMDKEALDFILDRNLKTTKSFVQMLFDGLKKELDQLRDENRLLRSSHESVGVLQEEVVKLIRDNSELKRSLEYSQAELEDLKSGLNDATSKLASFDLEDSSGSNFQERIRIVEDHIRRKNVRISGLPDAHNENSEQSLVKVRELISNKLNAPNVEILSASRIGSFDASSEQPRQIIAKLSSVEDKISCFKNSSKLKGSKIFVNEDVSAATLNIRKSKMNELLQKRKDGFYAYFSGTKIVAKKRTIPRQTSTDHLISDASTVPAANQQLPVASLNVASTSAKPNRKPNVPAQTTARKSNRVQK